MDHANEVGRALRRAGADKLPPTGVAYLYQRLAKGVDLDRSNLGGLADQGFGRPKGRASFPDLDAGARALVSTAFRAAPRAWGDVSDDDLAHLGRYPLRTIALGTAMDPDDALRKYHGLTPEQAIAAGWTRVAFPGCLDCAKPGWAPPGSDAQYGPTGPADRIPIPVRGGGVAYLTFAQAERAGASRDGDAWDLSQVKPIERANIFALSGAAPAAVRVGSAWRTAAYVAGGAAAVFVLTGVVRAAFSAAPDASPEPPPQDSAAPKRPTITLQKRDEQKVVHGSIQADGSTIWEDGSKWYPVTVWNDPPGTWPWPATGEPSTRAFGLGTQKGAKQSDGSTIWEDGSRTGGAHQRQDAPGTWGWPPPAGGTPTTRPTGTVTAAVQPVSPAVNAASHIAAETPAQSQHSQDTSWLEDQKNQILSFQGVGDAPVVLPELEITFRGLVADWEGFDRIGVGTSVLPDLAPDATAWRTFRDAWRAGTVAPADIVPGLEAETLRATRIRQALRDAAIVDPSLQLAVSASNAKAWIDTIPWLAWILKPGGTGALGPWRVPVVLGGIVVGLMLLSAIIKGRRGSKIYLLPPPKTG